jgi:hypothetical protein
MDGEWVSLCKPELHGYAEEIDELVAPYPAGAHRVCYVNPFARGEAVLRRSYTVEELGQVARRECYFVRADLLAAWCTAGVLCCLLLILQGLLGFWARRCAADQQRLRQGGAPALEQLQDPGA